MEKSTLLNRVDGLDFSRQCKIDQRLVESISKEIILVSERFFCNDRESSLNHEAKGQIIPEFSPN